MAIADEVEKRSMIRIKKIIYNLNSQNCRANVCYD